MIEEYKMTHGDPTVPGVQGGRAGSHAGHQTPSSQMDHHSINGGDSSENTPVSSKLGKMMSVKVLMLDDSITVFQVQAKAPGRLLFDQVCKQLSLLEVDYFGLEYQDGQGITYWLDIEKQLNHQVGLSTHESLLKFCVKFYTPDPSLIEEEYTRYLFGLQIKRDLAMAQLQCNDNTAALMASYIVQAECGDYVVEDYPDHTYLSSMKFVPHQDSELERKIMENHKKHVAQSPAEADLNLLETARRCELYGVKMHGSKDHEGVPLNLAVAHMGVLVFQNFNKINTFSWAKIRKLSFKRKKYLIKLHPEGYGYYKDTVEFYFDDRNQCKNFWKKCVEHHSFFRCSSSIAGEREKHRILSRGSSFRYSGKTQKQMQDYVRENCVKRQSFQRNAVRQFHSSMGNVGQSLSAQPLLPIGDISLGAMSVSCGSVSFGLMTNDGGVLYPNDLHMELEEQQPQYRSLPHKSRNYHYQPYPNYSSTVSTPRRPNLRPTPTGESLIDTSVASDNRSENTVIEQERISFTGQPQPPQPQRRSSNSSRSVILSSQENETGFLVVQGVGGPVAHVVGVEDGNAEPDILMDEGHVSSEDNLSHDSYELIEKTAVGNLIENPNAFEKEFYRQAAKLQSSQNGLSSSRTSSHCSLTMSPQVLKRDIPPVPLQQVLEVSNTNSMSRVKSQDSFSQASMHNMSLNNNNSDRETPPILPRKTVVGNAAAQAAQAAAQQQALKPNEAALIKEEGQRMMVDVIRVTAPQPQPRIYRPNYSHSLPRTNADLYQPNGNQQQSQQRRAHINTEHSSRTLPSRRKSPVYFSSRRMMGGNNPAECSSGSSSSHASPQIARPKSLEFATVVNANNMPNYPHDNLDHSVTKTPGIVHSRPIDPYDDSSSAINEQLSSSDVPQTPENPNVTFLPLEAGPVLVGCHQGTAMQLRGLKQYYNKEERIYDVPEGIEGVTAPLDIITSPSSSSGITEPYLPISKNPPPTTVPPPPPAHFKSPLPKLEIEPRKFQQTLLNSMGPQDSTESADSNSTRLFHIRTGKGSGIQSHYSTTTLPPPQRALLATMSSTESESALSARSAPTPISNPDQILIKQQQLHQQKVSSSTQEKPQILIEEFFSDYQPQESESPPLQVNLISPPAEESESSTAVLDSEGVPAPPPEFSGAAIVSDDDPQEATDVDEDDSQTQSHHQVVQATLAKPEDLDDQVEHHHEVQPEKDNPIDFINDDVKVAALEEEEDEDDGSSKVIKIADLYVKIEHENGSGSTISDEGNTGSDIAEPVPFIDGESVAEEGEEEEEVEQQQAESVEKVVEVCNLPTPQHAEAIFIPPTPPTNVSKSSEPELEEANPPTIEELNEADDDDPEIEIEIEEEEEVEIPPPPITHCDLKPEPSIDSNSSSSPPPPPPIMTADNGPPTAILNEVGFPFPPRALSRISEASSSKNPEQPEIVSRSGSEGGGQDTMTDQNYATSEGDPDANPPSLSSDLPENITDAGFSSTSRVMRAIAEFESRANNTTTSGSKDLPSPPSSMINTTEDEEVTLEGKTEVTLIEPDSLYLELNDPDHFAVINDQAVDNIQMEDSRIPYDLSISSENEVTNNEDDDGEKHENSEGSLHDSMEILEEIATEDHFDHLDRGTNVDSDQSFEQEQDIFEMPPMPDTLNNDSSSQDHQPPPPAGGQEFIF